MWWSIICLVLVHLGANSQISGLTLETSVGVISGISGTDFNSFLGIPYGVVDENRPFDEASPAPSFGTTYFANKDPVICPQLVRGTPQGSIHCLHLNIYTPNNSTASSSLAVMVFIHGGGFVEGDGNLNTYSPKFLMKKDIILVTFNYRLGPYGFLCLPSTKYSNQGLRDQALALNWVKKNILFFGGNPDDITLFGHSAGSISAELHLLFDDKKVFNKVILQSGFVVSPFMMVEAANEKYITEIVDKIALDTKKLNIEGMINKLSEKNPMELINITGNDVFRPCVDNVLVNKTPSLNLKMIKVMLGTAERETVFFYKDDQPAYQFFLYVPEQYLGKVKEFYLNGNNLKDNVMDFGTDYFFNYPVERSQRFYEQNADDVYRYVFAYDGGRNFIKVRDNITAEGATHGDELGYLFDADFLGEEITEDDQVMIETMTNWWTNFAKYGHADNSWPAVDKSKYYMKIGPSSIEKDFFKDKIEFWNEFYSMYGGCLHGVDFGEEYKCIGNQANIFNVSFTLTVIIGLILMFLILRLQ